MSTALVSPDHARASHRDLMALARYWEWERVVGLELPRVIAESAVECLFQPIYRIQAESVVARGFEAVPRFPFAPRVPVGMWFLAARERDLAPSLERATMIRALDKATRLHEEAFVSVSGSRESLPAFLRSIPDGLRGRLMVQLPHTSLEGPGGKWLTERVRREGAGIAIHDLIPETLAVLRPFLEEMRPDCVKVDMPDPADDAARKLLLECVGWCRETGVSVIAARVESHADLEVLESAGVEWAQGHVLSPPIEI